MTWKDRLAGTMAPELAREIDIFETQIDLKSMGRSKTGCSPKPACAAACTANATTTDSATMGWASARSVSRTDTDKGPGNAVGRPGHAAHQVPFGGLTPEQMDVLADVSEEYSDGICHVTTRQDIQLHFVHIEDTPDLMRRLAAVGITTREACGNTVRNVTACPIAGVCRRKPST